MLNNTNLTLQNQGHSEVGQTAWIRSRTSLFLRVQMFTFAESRWDEMGHKNVSQLCIDGESKWSGDLLSSVYIKDSSLLVVCLLTPERLKMDLNRLHKEWFVDGRSQEVLKFYYSKSIPMTKYINDTQSFPSCGCKEPHRPHGRARECGFHSYLEVCSLTVSVSECCCSAVSSPGPSEIQVNNPVRTTPQKTL